VAEHADQLSHLLRLMRLPSVSVGIIPADAQRRAIATIGFWIFDNNAVALETPTAAIKVTRPQEIARYVTMFDHLHREAVHGRAARRLITNLLATTVMDVYLWKRYPELSRALKREPLGA